MSEKIRIAVLVSGGGTNLQALIDAQKRGEIKGGKYAEIQGRAFFSHVSGSEIYNNLHVRQGYTRI